MSILSAGNGHRQLAGAAQGKARQQLTSCRSQGESLDASLL
jgi:hypothetical protein